MTATVRCYAHDGIIAMAVASYGGNPNAGGAGQFSLKQPYLGGEVLSANTSSAVSSLTTTAPAATKVLYVQVQPSKRVHYEITPGGQTPRTATTDSPIIINDLVLLFGPGWAISVLEAATDA